MLVASARGTVARFVGVTALGLAALSLAGCLRVPLGDPERSKVDERLAGFWLASVASDTGLLAPPKNERTVYCVRPFDQRTYLVTLMNYRTEDGVAAETIGTCTYKAWLTEVGGASFMTLEFMDPTDVFTAESDREWAVLRYELAGETVAMRQAAASFSKRATTPKELARFIRDNLADPALYEGEKEIYRKLTRDEAEQLLKIFEK